MDADEMNEAIYNATPTYNTDTKTGIPTDKELRRSRSVIRSFLKQLSPFTTVQELIDALD